MQPPGRQNWRVFGEVKDDKHVESSITEELKSLRKFMYENTPVLKQRVTKIRGMKLPGIGYQL
ncbi:uncharacterized protein RAG0_03139 [Rhynchosporium agropyri]|uniref:Uncharacterized protein n=2 Tax=Rhynchosporium TaxID=38037 RepID=A0A1E1MUS0_RHYSE|nr:uncharacterized protein RAG0_03139 [Rhynchosporium agropyri]CZT52837.1 uncharacterized protein RSE6_14218 [Rhynchosporium secalis]